MLNTKDTGLLYQIIDKCDRVNKKVYEINKDIFERDYDLQDIIAFNLMQIGELVKRLSNEFRKEYNKVSWSEIAGMRDKLVHHYDKLNLKVVWDTAFNDCPKLQAYCRDILGN